MQGQWRKGCERVAWGRGETSLATAGGGAWSGAGPWGSAQLSGWGSGGGGGGGGGAKRARARPAARAGAGSAPELLPEPQPVLLGAGAGKQALTEPSRAELIAWHRPELEPACQPQGLITVGGSERPPLGTIGNHRAREPGSPLPGLGTA